MSYAILVVWGLCMGFAYFLFASAGIVNVCVIGILWFLCCVGGMCIVLAILELCDRIRNKEKRNEKNQSKRNDGCCGCCGSKESK